MNVSGPSVDYPLRLEGTLERPLSRGLSRRPGPQRP